jgi:hypothetical protein
MQHMPDIHKADIHYYYAIFLRVDKSNTTVIDNSRLYVKL